MSSPNVSFTNMTAEEFIIHALKNGEWERYEHPTKGETLTLQIGKFPILSIHTVLVERRQPITQLMNMLDTKSFSIALLTQLAKITRELEVATQALADQLDD